MLKFLGFTAMCFGTAMADADNLLMPLGLMVIGAILLLTNKDV